MLKNKQTIIAIHSISPHQQRTQPSQQFYKLSNKRTRWPKSYLSKKQKLLNKITQVQAEILITEEEAMVKIVGQKSMQL